MQIQFFACYEPDHIYSRSRQPFLFNFLFSSVVVFSILPLISTALVWTTSSSLFFLGNHANSRDNCPLRGEAIREASIARSRGSVACGLHFGAQYSLHFFRSQTKYTKYLSFGSPYARSRCSENLPINAGERKNGSFSLTSKSSSVVFRSKKCAAQARSCSSSLLS